MELKVANFNLNDNSSQELLDSAYNILNQSFDLIIIKNLENKNVLDLINNRILLKTFKNAYFIDQGNELSVSILSKRQINIKVLSVMQDSCDSKLGLLVDFKFKGNHYGIVIYNLSNDFIKNPTSLQISEQILYLKAQIDKLMFILDESEFVIFDLLIKNGFFSLINDSDNIPMLANKIDFRVFSNFFAKVSLNSFMFVITDYLHSNYVIENFPQKIVIN
ncbi:hypothetical protein Bmayo_03820 [Borreliella mayonii]|uniref:Uncharacterized protein n=1 Tax=Borreliella mayonii TaxID=1674146 RepID=A0AAC9KZC8_9SPIR|nr:hypothetical protein [Borreliella mayonii]APS99035.1 hypothetical protein A7X70_03820 [Borreliella mayonii]APT00154.1 hypothetical protein Bmayo_03820 [Borreliella mayonii]